jgi:hypothetical protein
VQTTLTPETEGLREARARHQSDLATAEEHYAASLRSLGDPRASEVAARGESHRAKAARIRRGVE